MRRAAFATFLSATAALAGAVPALAQGPAPSPAPAPTPTPAPAPQPGSAALALAGGVTSHGRLYVMSGSTVTLSGKVTPYVAGQTVGIRISTPHHKPARAHATIGKGGVFSTRFHTRQAARYTVYVSHPATPQQAAFNARTSVNALAEGSGMAVALLKQGMRALGYPAGNGPFVTAEFGRALLAFRKVNDMARIYTADSRIYQMVFAGQGAFKLRYPKAGKHVEADLSKQVVVLADKGRPVATYPTSSGKPSTPTILGHYQFYLKAPGTNAKGMYMSNYFTGGYAIHGYPDVPTYNASHGCLRISNADAVAVFNQINLGESIWVYP